MSLGLFSSLVSDPHLSLALTLSPGSSALCLSRVPDPTTSLYTNLLYSASRAPLIMQVLVEDNNLSRYCHCSSIDFDGCCHVGIFATEQQERLLVLNNTCSNVCNPTFAWCHGMKIVSHVLNNKLNELWSIVDNTRNCLRTPPVSTNCGHELFWIIGSWAIL